MSSPYPCLRSLFRSHSLLSSAPPASASLSSSASMIPLVRNLAHLVGLGISLLLGDDNLSTLDSVNTNGLTVSSYLLFLIFRQ
jgi:hypothetical protein